MPGEPARVAAAARKGPAAAEPVPPSTTKALAFWPTGPQDRTASGAPKISRATAGSTYAAASEQPEPWATHQAVLASALAISSMTATNVAGSTSSPP
jgi:hypothetical protein